MFSTFAPGLRGSRIPTFALALAAGAHAATTVTLAITRKADGARAIEARVHGTDGRHRCLWRVMEKMAEVGKAQGVDLMVAPDGASALLSVTPGPQTRAVTVRVTSQADPTAWKEETFLVPRAGAQAPAPGLDTKAAATAGNVDQGDCKAGDQGDSKPAPGAAIPLGPHARAVQEGLAPYLVPRVMELVAAYDDADERDRLTRLLEQQHPSWHMEHAQWLGVFGDLGPAHPTCKTLQGTFIEPLAVNRSNAPYPIVGFDCPVFFSFSSSPGFHDERYWLITQSNHRLGGGGMSIKALEGPRTEEVFTEPVAEVAMESVTPEGDGKDSFWLSRRQVTGPLLRGQFLLAGDPATPPRPFTQDGKGSVARFHGPHGVAALSQFDPSSWLDKPHGHPKPRRLVVADEKDHVLRIVYAEGPVKTVWGRPGEMGGTDAAFGDARFNGPTGVAVQDTWAPSRKPGRREQVENIYVSDTGNHKVRLARWDGLARRFPATGYAAPGLPLGLALERHPHAQTRTLLASSGSCLIELGCVLDESEMTTRLREVLAERPLTLKAPAKVAANQDFEASFWIPDRRLARAGLQAYNYLYTVEWLEADGSRTPAPREEGRGHFGEDQTLQGRFAQPGKATAWLRIVIPDGHSFDAEREVEVVKNLWTGPAKIEKTVPAWGGFTSQQRGAAAAQDQRFAGECRLATEGLVQGRVQIDLQFTDSQGRILAAGPAASEAQEAVHPGSTDDTRLRVERTAPAGAAQVHFRLRVEAGSPGADVIFDQILFHRIP